MEHNASTSTKPLSYEADSLLTNSSSISALPNMHVKGRKSCMNPFTVWPCRAGPKADEAGPKDTPKAGRSGGSLRRLGDEVWESVQGQLHRLQVHPRLYIIRIHTVRGEIF